jgi:hypothetical protein
VRGRADRSGYMSAWIMEHSIFNFGKCPECSIWADVRLSAGYFAKFDGNCPRCGKVLWWCQRYLKDGEIAVAGEEPIC